jgi:two-component system sensor histidine kinase/response regulator
MKTGRNNSINCKSEILVAEDSPKQAAMLKCLLESSNYKVLLAPDGQQALEKLSQNKPALVISDIVMPVLNGYELCEKIKSDESTAHIPVILMTSLSDPEEVIEGLSCGADSFITKPFNNEFLLSSIEKILSERTQFKSDREKLGLEINHGGKKRQIRVEAEKVVSFMLNTYQAAINRNNELIQTQEELRKLNGRLESLLKDRTTKLKFFSIIAHDLRSPFQGLLNITEMMSDTNENFTVTELTEFSKSLNQTANNLYQLLGNLLEWAMIQKGSLSFSPQEFSLSVPVLQILKLINERVLQKGISVVVEVPDNQKLYADVRMIGAILRNLLSNAVKFTNRGGIVCVKSKNIENEMIEISVSDTGIGMSESILKKLFKINENVGSTGTDGELSNGLGLILCKEFVDIQKGKIWVESKPGQGSTFFFTIPESKNTKR